jgi:hypothetical protein
VKLKNVTKLAYYQLYSAILLTKLQGGISYKSTIYCELFSGEQFPKNTTYFYETKFKHTQQTHSSSFDCMVNLTTVQHSSEF